MYQVYYNVEQIAKMLSIHPKTIQRYIREGKLRATKIGKSWRVSGHDLSRFIEGEKDCFCKTAYPPREKTKVSSVIDISAINKDEAIRIINSLTAVMNVKPPEYGFSSMHTQFIESDSIVRITLWGNIQFMSAILQSVEVLTQTKEEEA